jgi:hypothetical protein
LAKTAAVEGIKVFYETETPEKRRLLLAFWTVILSKRNKFIILQNNNEVKNRK